MIPLKVIVAFITLVIVSVSSVVSVLFQENTEREFTLIGTVTDEYTSLPVVGVTVSLRDRVSVTDEQGRFSFEEVKGKGVVALEARGYEPQSVPYEKGSEIRAALRPNTLTGVVMDGRDGQPLPGATVFLDQSVATTDSEGKFHFANVPRYPKLRVKATGYETRELLLDKTTKQEVKLSPFEVKGLYLTFYTVGWEERREHLFSLVDRTELNAVVMDVKGDQGLVNAGVGITLSKNIGAEVRLVDDLGSLVARLKQKGVYTIARIVVFKDSVLASQRPDLAVQDSGTGGIYVDCENQRWVDPFSKTVWEYNIAIAEESARQGFDEIQFDYIRFPSDCIQGSLVYSRESPQESRVNAINGFLAAAAARLRPLGVAVAADTFGWTTMREDDMGIGQLLEGIARQVDYLSPMVYPSTWGPGSLGLEYPPAQPYEIVFKSLTRAMERLQSIPNVKVRPWLQDYPDYGSRKLAYGVREVNLQKRAAKDARTWGWMIWDARVTYTEAALEPASR